MLTNYKYGKSNRFARIEIKLVEWTPVISDHYHFTVIP